MADSFLAGIGLGLMVAAPVGPMGLLCIHRTLAAGASAGVATGFGAATVHLGYSAIAALGLGVVATAWLEGRAVVLSIVSALVLLWFAGRAMCRKASASSPIPIGPRSISRSYFSAIALGVANPATVLLFAAALPAMADPEHTAAALWLAAGAFAGSMAWWVMLVAMVVCFRARLGTRALEVSARASAVVLASLAAVMLLNALGPEL
ncbi:MAG TPA: LysE family transporter [Vineibacter sp.]|nr:LysE family transporter [Vineibacter sp.]